MKWILMGLLAMSLMACESQNNQTAEPTQNVSEPPAAAQKSAAKPPQSNNRVNYIKDTSRPKEEIEAKFPHDIDLKTADGKLIKSNKLLRNGKRPVVLLFWLTTCFPCKMQMAKMQESYADLEKETGVKMFAISVDFQKNYKKFAAMVEEKDWPWPAYNDWNREFRRVMPGGLNGMPQTFLLDGNGDIVYHKRKYRPGDEEELYSKIRELVQ